MKIERNESIFLEILFLRTLYANKKAVWWTSVIQILATLVIYVKTDHPIYAAFALAFFLIVLGRTANANAFEQKDLSSATMTDLRTWEWRYLVGAISTCILLGLLCLVSIYVLADPSAAITSVAIVVASMVALVTRNYVSPTVVIGMSIGVLAPLFLTFVLLGGIYNWLLALLILPYFWSNIRIASKLRQSLWDALLGKQQLSVVVSHFDAALNGMPQGLLMFDRNQTITVANMKAAKMMGFDEPDQVHGHSLQSLLRLARVKAYFPEETQASLSGKMQDLLSGRKERDMFVSPAKRHYEFTATPDPEHGTVLIFQDVTRRAEAEAQISRMARYDSLRLISKDFSHKGLIGLLQKIDHSFAPLARNGYRAANRDGFLVDLIKPTPKDRMSTREKTRFSADEEDLQAIEIEGLTWLVNSPKISTVVIDEKGYPLDYTCPDPRAFALHKLWLSRRSDRDAAKRVRDELQARTVAGLIRTRLPHLSFEANDLQALPLALRQLAPELDPVPDDDAGEALSLTPNW